MTSSNLTTAPDEPGDETTDLYSGLGSVVYALAHVDKQVHFDNLQTVRDLLTGIPNGNLALSAYFQRDHCNETAEEAYALALNRFASNRKTLNAIIRAQFVNILLQIADANGNVSPKQQELINRFRRDLRRLSSA
ncbi:TerB family tellurite resistance protein [Spirosoma utsteinense]|uniref:Tellurite resistance protein B-like protein n=1 Tax=Spirosoma utsteinense TaxID=2585773 RepID=A0ABR6W710_9BACT|nr:TerB family tellurite resistance protein [Spirosoma utsteinense]MBC3786178.1 putative tellurite resistance protein B-like protein [Spirosoma utsteinense]MBC3792368.1 putative tellurite resistance protein B-like protein [Spirosoma utsteinense]